jgi:hypothetical protein
MKTFTANNTIGGKPDMISQKREPGNSIGSRAIRLLHAQADLRNNQLSNPTTDTYSGQAGAPVGRRGVDQLIAIQIGDRPWHAAKAQRL